MDSKRLLSLDTYDGFRLDMNKQFSPWMLGVHSFWLGTSMIPDGGNKTYNFRTQVADEGGLLMAGVDPIRGSIDGRIHRSLFGGNLMGKLQLSLSTEGSSDQLLAETDFGGQTWTGNLKYGSMGGGLMYGCNYFQGITKNLSLGGEGLYLASNEALLSSYTAKYQWETPDENKKPKSGSMVANFNSGQGVLTLNYKQTITQDRVNIGAELQCSPVTLDSQVVFGAEVNMQRSKFNVSVDGTKSCKKSKD